MESGSRYVIITMKTYLTCMLFLLCPFIAATQQPDTLPSHRSDNSGQQPAFVCGLQETMPEYPGGTAAMKDYIHRCLLLPDSLKDMEGRVVVNFILTEKGLITDARIMRSLHPVTDSMVLNIIRHMPAWKPARFMGKPVAATYILPVIVRQE